MGRGRVTETELMPRLVVGYTELGCSKLKKGNGFLKPNFELGPNWASSLKRNLRFRLAPARLGFHCAVELSQGLIPGAFFCQRGTVNLLFTHDLTVVFHPAIIDFP